MQWDAFRQGDEPAFTALFLAHYEALYGYGLKLTSNEELVRDSIQEMFQKLWERRSRLDAVDEVKPYLFKVLRHRISDNLRSAARRHTRQQAYITEEFEVVYSPEDFFMAEQSQEAQYTHLLALLNQLPPRQREAIYLRYFGGFAYERITEIMNLTTQSVRNLIHQALKTLKQALPLASLLLGVAYS